MEPGQQKWWAPVPFAVLRSALQNAASPYSDELAWIAVQLDYNTGRESTIAGWAKQWGWSRDKVSKFLRDIGIELKYAEETKKKQNQRGTIEKKTDQQQIIDRSTTDVRQIPLFKYENLGGEKNRYSTDKRQVRNRQSSTPSNRDKKEEGESPSPVSKSSKQSLGEFGNVQFTEFEFSQLCEKYGESMAGERINKLSIYMKSKGKSYPNHYATILDFAARDGIQPIQPGQQQMNAEEWKKIQEMEEEII